MTTSPRSPCGSSLSSSSTTFISVPPTGTPIEPGLRSRSGRLNEPMPVVSERPYPSSTLASKASSTRCSTSTGGADPPATQRSIEETSCCSRSGWWSRAVYIVGTPANDDTPSRSMISSALPGSKRGTRVSAPRGREAGRARRGAGGEEGDFHHRFHPEDVEEGQGRQPHAVGLHVHEVAP